MYDINFNNDFNYYGYRNSSYSPSKNSISIQGQNTFNGFYGISKIKVNKYNPLCLKYKIIAGSSYNWDAGSGIGIYIMNTDEYSTEEFQYYGTPSGKKISISNTRKTTNGSIFYRYVGENQSIYSDKIISYPYKEISVEFVIKDNHIVAKNNDEIFIDSDINMDTINDEYYLCIYFNNYNNSIIKFYDMQISNGLYFLSSRNKYYDLNDENYLNGTYKNSDINDNMEYTILYDFCKIRDIAGENLNLLTSLINLKYVN